MSVVHSGTVAGEWRIAWSSRCGRGTTIHGRGLHHNAYVMRSGVWLTLVRIILYRYIEKEIFFFAVDENCTWQATCAPPSKKQMSALQAQNMASLLERILWDNHIYLRYFAGLSHVLLAGQGWNWCSVRCCTGAANWQSCFSFSKL